MRDFAKSAISLGWALSLLGVKQAYGFVANDPVRDGDVFASITQATVDQLDDSMKRVHRCATNMESYVVDMAFSFPNPIRWVNPRRWKNGWSTANCGQPATPADPAPAGNESPAASAGSQSNGASPTHSQQDADCGCSH
ncbi:MAG: hypothetical protein ABSA78_08660 [Candidatus Sulfotelmatobacter sp.]|jgi:hypothetical protein